MNKIEILGVKINNLTMEEVLKDIEMRLMEKNFKGYITTPNPEIILMAQKNKELFEILNKSYLSVPDGIGLVIMSKILGMPLKQRIAGIDLMIKICAIADKLGQSVCLLGKWPEAIKKAIENFNKIYPRLNIFSYEDLDINSCENCRFDILFIGLGAPEQEKWIKNNFNNLSIKLALTVGGAFEMIAGIKPRAPKIFRKLWLEWLWRFLLEPRKRYKRIFRAVVIFPIKVIISNLQNLKMNSRI